MSGQTKLAFGWTAKLIGVGDRLGRTNTLGHVCRQKLMSKRLQQPTVDAAAVGKSNLQFGRMNVDIDHLGRHVHAQETDRMSPDHQQPTIGFSKGVLQCTVSNVTTVEKQVLHAVVAARDRWITNVSADSDLRVVTLDGNQRLRDLGAKECLDSIGPTRCDWQIV